MISLMHSVGGVNGEAGKMEVFGWVGEKMFVDGKEAVVDRPEVNIAELGV